MSDVVITKGRLRVYACGGAGMNIGGMLEKHRNQLELAFAEMDIVYIDTSKSNMGKHIDQTHCYLLDNLDGSGKLRTENHKEIDERVKDILQKYKPADMNIVLHSAAGGSGSVIGPLLVRQMLVDDCSVLALTIGSADTRLDAENTLKTMKSYDSIAKQVGAPVVMGYAQNSQETSRADADQTMYEYITHLTILFSRENRELDSRDLYNWLRYNRVTTHQVQLVTLSLVEGSEVLTDLGNIISVATLAKENTSTTLLNMPEYQCVGFLPAAIQANVASKSPVHFIISDGLIGGIVKNLQDILSNLEKLQAARVPNKSIVSSTDKAQENGLVL
jgi:hypothetical protein